MSWPTHEAVLARPVMPVRSGAQLARLLGKGIGGKRRFSLFIRRVTRYFSRSNVIDVDNRVDAAAPIYGMRDAWFEQRWLYR
jgi:hypothetical protein